MAGSGVEAVMHRVSHYSLIVIQGAIILGSVFNAGMWCQKRWYGEARVFTNVNEGSPLNHGQRTIGITLPEGVVFSGLGGCVPQWEARGHGPLYWTTASLHEERYDPTIHGFVPSESGNGLVELKP